MKFVSKVMFYMLVLAMILLANKTYYYQNNLETIILEEVFTWQFKGAFAGKLLISVVSVMSFFMYRKYFPGYVTFCYIAIMLLVVKASYSDLDEIVKNPSFFYSGKGIGTFINMGIIFYAADKVHLKKILNLFYYLCFFFLLAGVANLGKVGFGSSRNQYLYAVRDFTVYLIWVFPFFLLQEGENKVKNLVNFSVFVGTGLFVLATGSRSYLLIYAIYFIAKFKDQLRKKNSVLIILGVSLVMVLAFFIFSGSGLGKTMEGAVTNLSQRSGEDSRSSQLTEFWQQYDLDYLIEGVGPRATWYWTAIGPYPYLDNQFLLLSWWAGLPALLVYVYFLLRTFFQKSEITLFENVKGIRLIVFWWILACMGFAIYIGIASELYYSFITLLMGLHVCRFSMIKTEDDIEEA